MADSFLPALAIEPRGPHRSTIIWLHGLGADGYDFEPIVAELDLPDSLGVRFLLPHAPHRAVTINNGYVMRAWYDIAAPDLGRAPDVAGVAASVAAVQALVEREIAAGIAPERIMLAGFSQGAVIAVETACHLAGRVGGAIGLSGYLVRPDEIPAAAAGFRIFLGHGRQDTVVQVARGEAARDRLAEQGYAVEWHSYDLPHSVSMEEIEDIRSWLLRLWQSN